MLSRCLSNSSVSSRERSRVSALAEGPWLQFRNPQGRQRASLPSGAATGRRNCRCMAKVGTGSWPWSRRSRRTWGSNSAIRERTLLALDYPVLLTPDDNGTLLVTCPDLPGSLLSAAQRPTRCGRLAMPSKRPSQPVSPLARYPAPDRVTRPAEGKAAAKGGTTVASVALPTQTALKAMLHRALRAQNLRKADLESAAWSPRPASRPPAQSAPRLAPRPDRGRARGGSASGWL